MARKADQNGTATTDSMVDSQERILEALSSALDRLEDCLKTELEALAICDPVPLLKAVEHKRLALQTVERLVNHSSVQTMLAVSSSSAGGAQAPNPPLAHLAAWPRVLAKLALCRNLNQAAGGAVAAARQSIADTLQLLGHDSGDATYGVDGNPSRATPAPRNLATC